MNYSCTRQTLDAVLDTLLDRGGGGNPDVIGDIITMSGELFIVGFHALENNLWGGVVCIGVPFLF